MRGPENTQFSKDALERTVADLGANFRMEFGKIPEFRDVVLGQQRKGMKVIDESYSAQLTAQDGGFSLTTYEISEDGKERITQTATVVDGGPYPYNHTTETREISLATTIVTGEGPKIHIILDHTNNTPLAASYAYNNMLEVAIKSEATY